ncbi:MAG: methyltransferase domain-containing protein, partial [Methylobacteriaceae bacterium]|nr:methyltransferase domain-containing protein [Methylobacteriaceae bacterium]
MGDPAAASDWRRERRRRLLAHVDPARETGLELGPRTSPIVTREDGHVLYADRLSTPELRAFYRDTIEAGELDPAAFVDVDLVVPDGASLAAALGERGPVDYVVASHVLEHLADPVGWLADIAACLREGGHLCLAVPDKRFTFDHLREPTLARELLGWAV